MTTTRTHHPARCASRMPGPDSGGRRVPTLDHVWLAGALTFAFLLATLLPAGVPDYWWTVKLGDGLWATHQWPAADLLSFTATRQPYVEQQWLAQLVLAAVHAAGGLEAALLLRAAILVLTAASLYHAARRADAPPAAAAVTCLLALVSIVGGAAVRPQLLAIPLFTLFLLGTTIWTDRPWTLLALPLAMILWANVHGSFPLGISLVGAALLGRLLPVGWRQGSGRALRQLRQDPVVRRLAALLALCTLAPLVNPYGLGIVLWLADYLRLNLGSAGLPPLSQEWLPTSFATAHGTLFFLNVLLAIALLVRSGLPSPGDGLRLLVFGVLGLQAVRNTLWWAIVAAPLLAWGLSGASRDSGRGADSGAGIGPAALPAGGHANATRKTTLGRGMGPEPAAHPAAGVTDGAERRAREPGNPAVNALLILGFTAVAVLSLPWLRPRGLLFGPDRWPLAPPDLPVAAAEHVARGPATRLYNSLDWGGYLAWRLAPHQRMFVDARFQLYPSRVYTDYFAIAQARPGWAERLAAYGVDGLVLSRATQPDLLRALAADDAWQAVYCDDRAAVYLPRESASGPTAECPAEP